MPPTYELLWNSSSGTIMTIKLEDERYNIIEMDINGKMLQIQNMSPEEWFTKSKYPNMHGIIYTSQGIINIRNKKWKDDFSPLDEELGLVTSQVHSKAYVRHLFMSGEMLGSQLAILQNLSFYLWLVNSAREEILKNNFTIWKDEILSKITRRL